MTFLNMKNLLSKSKYRLYNSSYTTEDQFVKLVATIKSNGLSPDTYIAQNYIFLKNPHKEQVIEKEFHSDITPKLLLYVL